MSKEASFWYDTDPDYKGYGQLKDKIETDVAIIGGGITGTSSAFHLAKKGIKTVVLDKKFVAAGATGKSTGFCVLGNEEDLYRALEQYPESFMKKLWDSTKYSVQLLKDAVREENLDCDFVDCGGLFLASRADHIERLKKEAAARRKFGYHADILSQKEVKDRVAVSNHHGALHTGEERSINPVKLVRGLAKAAVKNGAEVFENSGVQKISFDDNKVILKTEDGEVTAKALVVATDSYTRELGFLREKIIPFYDHVLATEPLTEAQISELGWNKNRELIYDSYRYYNYMRLSPDNRIMIGNSESWAEGGKIADTIHKKEHSRLYDTLIDFFPQLKGISVSHKWVGCLGYTPDFLPLIGKSKEVKSPIYSVGFNGHGIALGFLSGKLLADLYTQGYSYYADVYSVERDLRMHSFRAQIANSRLPEKMKYALINTHLQLSRFAERNF